jgi:hypothetical protein
MPPGPYRQRNVESLARFDDILKAAAGFVRRHGRGPGRSLVEGVSCAPALRPGTEKFSPRRTATSPSFAGYSLRATEPNRDTLNTQPCGVPVHAPSRLPGHGRVPWNQFCTTPVPRATAGQWASVRALVRVLRAPTKVLVGEAGLQRPEQWYTLSFIWQDAAWRGNECVW